jgi:hypothetical protein
MIKNPPKLVFNDQGDLIEVIVTAADFKVYVQSHETK